MRRKDKNYFFEIMHDIILMSLSFVASVCVCYTLMYVPKLPNDVLSKRNHSEHLLLMFCFASLPLLSVLKFVQHWFSYFSISDISFFVFPCLYAKHFNQYERDEYPKIHNVHFPSKLYSSGINQTQPECSLSFKHNLTSRTLHVFVPKLFNH